MKIYFIGAHSQGKSTLSSHIAEKYNLALLPEVARNLILEKDISLEELRADLKRNDEFQLEIWNRQLKKEKDLDNFISDRSFDCLAYVANHSKILSSIIKSKEFIEYIEKLKQKDVLIFYIKPHKDLLKIDGVRENPDWDNILIIDGMIKLLLELFELRYFQINTINMQERVNLVDSVISLLI